MSRHALMMLAASMTTTAMSKVPVTFIEEQGCPDCTKYGSRFVVDGLDHGLGSAIELKVYLRTLPHPGFHYDTKLHGWVACANFATGASDSDYFWYRVAACANGNPANTSAVDRCMNIVPCNNCKDVLAEIGACMSNSTLLTQLVADMHAIGDAAHDYPVVTVRDKPVPEPDTHGDDPSALIEQVCSLAQPPLPPACAQK